MKNWLERISTEEKLDVIGRLVKGERITDTRHTLDSLIAAYV